MALHSNARGHQPFDPLLPNLLREDSREDGAPLAQSDEVTTGQAWCLYLSHFLSMWNSRTYEFGAILFIQSAFPGNLTASSINGIAETLCVLLFSSALGRWVDRSPSRLRPLLLTIIINRTAVVISCTIWFLIFSTDIPTHKHILFAFVLILGMVEKNSRMTNILSMERDWVPTLASTMLGTKFDLTHLNTVMRRIDILCKLIAPLVLSTFISAIASMKVAVFGVAFINILGCGLEYWSAQNVWRQNHRLRVPKKVHDHTMEHSDVDTQSQSSIQSYPKERSTYSRLPVVYLLRITSQVKSSAYSHMDGLRYFFSSSVWIPSICAAVLHASVLTYSGTLITYLLNYGFSLSLLTSARAVGSLFEISSTFIFPWAVRSFSKSGFHRVRVETSVYGTNSLPRTDAEDPLLQSNSGEEVEVDEDGEQKPTTQNLDVGVVRVGSWGICGQFLNLIPVIISLFCLTSTFQGLPFSLSSSPSPQTTSDHPIIAYLPIICLVAFLSISLLGRWTYDLSVTQLTQTLIPASHRSGFGGTEMAIVSFVSLGHWIAAAVWHDQTDFKWLALVSFVATGVAAGTYWMWARRWERARGVETD